MKKRPTVTVGIPAFNEEANIERLLRSLLCQKQSNYKIDNITVYSDKSTDNTDNIVRSFKSKKIKLVRSIRKLGKPLLQNKMVSNLKSDFLVIIDADTLPTSKLLLDKLVANLLSGKKVGMVGGKTVPLSPQNNFEKILYFTTLFKDELYNTKSNGNNIYFCHGRIRAFRKELLKTFRWGNTYSEDAYSYLKCLSSGFEFKYVRSVGVYYKLPTTMPQHLNQSYRFFRGNRLIAAMFDGDLLHDSYHLPLDKALFIVIKYFLIDPVKMAAYIFILIISACRAYLGSAKMKWEHLTETKNLRIV